MCSHPEAKILQCSGYELCKNPVSDAAKIRLGIFLGYDFPVNTEEILGQPYRSRTIDVTLQRVLRAADAVVIKVARASEKTMAALNVAGSFIFV